jgi:pantothenate kinase
MRTVKQEHRSSSMENTYTRLATEICSAAAANSPRRLIVGIAGPPGSGKSTIAERVVSVINQAPAATPKYCAQAVSLDGFHHPRHFLDNLPNRDEAYGRRGAPWTFDVDGVLELVVRICQSAKLPAEQRPTILAPSFDHAVKDPIPDETVIQPETSIVILDGNYLLLDEDKWRDLSLCLDFKIFVNINPWMARDRVVKRHVAAGIEPDLQRAQARFDSNDLLNGQLIRSKRLSCDVVVESISDV